MAIEKKQCYCMNLKQQTLIFSTIQIIKDITITGSLDHWHHGHQDEMMQVNCTLEPCDTSGGARRRGYDVILGYLQLWNPIENWVQGIQGLWFSQEKRSRVHSLTWGWSLYSLCPSQVHGWPSDSDRDLLWSLCSSASHQRAFGWFNDDQWWFGPPFTVLEILYSWNGCLPPMPPQAEARKVARAGQLKRTPQPRLPQQRPQPARTVRPAWPAQPAQPVPQNPQQTARCGIPPPQKSLIHQRRETTQPKEPASGAYWRFFLEQWIGLLVCVFVLLCCLYM